MDPTGPLTAARLLDFVRHGSRDRRPFGYNVIFGFNQNKLARPITRMTFDELIGVPSSFTSRFGSSASGAYKSTRAGTRTEVADLPRMHAR